MTTVPGECLICARYIQKKTTVNYGTDFVELKYHSLPSFFESKIQFNRFSFRYCSYG
jgi:hypothetical protein